MFVLSQFMHCIKKCWTFSSLILRHFLTQIFLSSLYLLLFSIFSRSPRHPRLDGPLPLSEGNHFSAREPYHEVRLISYILAILKSQVKHRTGEWFLEKIMFLVDLLKKPRKSLPSKHFSSRKRETVRPLHTWALWKGRCETQVSDARGLEASLCDSFFTSERISSILSAGKEIDFLLLWLDPAALRHMQATLIHLWIDSVA